jgi:hypothetical protein
MLDMASRANEVKPNQLLQMNKIMMAGFASRFLKRDTSTSWETSPLRGAAPCAAELVTFTVPFWLKAPAAACARNTTAHVAQKISRLCIDMKPHMLRCRSQGARRSAAYTLPCLQRSAYVARHIALFGKLLRTDLNALLQYYNQMNTAPKQPDIAMHCHVHRMCVIALQNFKQVQRF